MALLTVTHTKDLEIFLECFQDKKFSLVEVNQAN